MQAVILAGGKGTRLASRLGGRPKPLVPVDGVPLLERQLIALARNGVQETLILVNHAAEQIEAFVENRDFGCRIAVINDGAPLGTAGAVLACFERLADEVVVVYGDTLFDIDIEKMREAHEWSGSGATLLLHPNDHPADSDLVEVDEEGQIVAFHAYPHPGDAVLPNLVNAAFYIMSRRFLEPYRNFRTPADFAKDLFPAALKNGAKLHGYRSFEYIKDLGTPGRLDKAERQLRQGVVARARRRVPQAAVFFDRDGTLNELRDYVRRPEELILLPGAAAAIKRLNDHEKRVIVVTNQPVIARGECSVEGLRQIHASMDTQLGHKGAYVDALYYCPHHPDRGYPGEVTALKIDCECRKPKTGLIERAIAELNIDRNRSFLVGDSSTDILAARRAGLASILLLTGERGADGRVQAVPDFIMKDVMGAVEFILEVYPRIAQSLADLAGRIAPRDLVLIGGLARSGKSTVAAVLSRLLRADGLTPALIALDSWIKEPSERGAGVMGRFDLHKARSVLGPWLDGGSAQIRVPIYERRTRTLLPGSLLVLNENVVVVCEGVPALNMELETTRRIHRIYVESDEEKRRARVVVDLLDRGAERSEAERIYCDRQADETPVIERCRVLADHAVCLDGLLSSHPVEVA